MLFVKMTATEEACVGIKTLAQQPIDGCARSAIARPLLAYFRLMLPASMFSARFMNGLTKYCQDVAADTLHKPHRARNALVAELTVQQRSALKRVFDAGIQRCRSVEVFVSLERNREAARAARRPIDLEFERTTNDLVIKLLEELKEALG